MSEIAISSAGRPALDEGPMLFLIDARNGVERNYLLDWIHATWGAVATDGRPRYVTLPLSDDSRPLQLEKLAARLDEDPRRQVVPVRIAWQIPHFDKGRGLRLRDLLFGDPRYPGRVRARTILLRNRRRAQCLAGEPATVAELRARFAQQVVPENANDALEFAGFVARQAALVLDAQERGVRGSRYKVPRFIADSIRTSPRFRSAVQRLATDTGRSVADLNAETRRYMKELIARPSALFLDLRARLDRFMLTAGYDEQMAFDPAEVEALRRTIRRHPTLLLFTHKTYIDGTTPTYLLYNNDLPMLHSFGGINLDFAGAGTLFRNSGMIFIRRSFQDNAPYKLVLRHYIAWLLEKRFPMSWAFEGTRSRLGKLMPPRYGLLKYVLDAAHDSGIENVHLVPFVTSFDLIRDVEEYVTEQTGRVKQPESLKWFIGYLQSLRQPMGRIRVDLGAPVVVKRAPAPDDKQALTRIAFDVSVQANRVTPLTVTSVICLGLLGTAPRGATAGELRGFVRYIAWWARARGIRMTSDLTGRDRAAIGRTIDTLVNSGLLIRDTLGSTRVYAIDPARHPVASYYRNTVVHHFLDKAIIELSLYKAAEADADTAAAFWAETERLRELFKFEFYYLPRDEFKASLAAELSRVDPDWPSRLAAGGEALHELTGRFQPLLGHAVLLPYVESYSVVFGLLARLKAGETLTEQACTDLALKEGRQAYLLRRITSEASIGKILFQNGYKLAGNLGLLASDEADTVLRARKALVREFRELARRLERMRLDMLASADARADQE
jgi:glycerol-3-phosphate O-acyltransferase